MFKVLLKACEKDRTVVDLYNLQNFRAENSNHYYLQIFTKHVTLWVIKVRHPAEYKTAFVGRP